MRTLTRSAIAVLVLTLPAFSAPLQEQLAYTPHRSRVIEVFFTVDDMRYLDRPLLEIILPQERFLRHIIPVTKAGDVPYGQAKLEGIVPEGNVKMVVCGLVACPHKETEAQCAEVTIPESIVADRTHQIDYSTRYACEGPRSVAMAPPQ